jgi:hypothetical protein
MAAYARQAKKRELEADAIEIRFRATRRLDQLRQAQKETVGPAAGGWKSRGLSENPQDKPTLAPQGVDKNLAHQARPSVGTLQMPAYPPEGGRARMVGDSVFFRHSGTADVRSFMGGVCRLLGCGGSLGVRDLLDVLGIRSRRHCDDGGDDYRAHEFVLVPKLGHLPNSKRLAWFPLDREFKRYRIPNARIDPERHFAAVH